MAETKSRRQLTFLNANVNTAINGSKCWNGFGVNKDLPRPEYTQAFC